MSLIWHNLGKMQNNFKTPRLWVRMASWLYEGILIFGVGFVADYLLDTLSQSRHALQNRELRIGYLFIIFGVYFVWFWAKGQTLAMKTWRIRLVNRHGKTVSQARALLRYCLSWAWFLPPLAASKVAGASLGESILFVFGWVTFWALLSRLHPTGQFWHDAMSGTKLVEMQPLPH